MVQPLSKEAFGAAIRAGRGRAYLHVQRFGLSGVADLVLAACLHDQAYDPQGEPSRAGWLLSMFEGSIEYPSFSSSIVAALDRETDTWDSLQLCELAALMAKKGDTKAGEALRKRVLRQGETNADDWVGTKELLSLEGIAAVAGLARCYGRTFTKNPEYSPSLFLDDFTDDPGLLAQAETILQELASSDADIGAYLAYWHREKAMRAVEASKNRTFEELRETRRQRLRQLYPLEKILQDATAEIGDSLDRYWRFGQNATSEELDAVFQRIEQEPAEGV
jgi:hypothetical protein